MMNMFLLLAFVPAAVAVNEEENRVKDSGQVLSEIMNIPDNIPQGLICKAECLIILPSVTLHVILVLVVGTIPLVG